MARILGAISASELSLRNHMDEKFKQQQESIASLEEQIQAMQAFIPGYPPPPPAGEAASEHEGTEILSDNDLGDA